MQRRAILQPDPALAPTLSKLNAWFTVGAVAATSLSVNIDAHTFDSDEAADDFDYRLLDKMGKTYTQGRTSQNPPA